ncbi:hypothetical protein E2562_014446 [Oryza meyeriana var. granulata]|uniref:Uncharacterized protein n=1 Tax=Oryza meyeriana var. granulata TaxID=110450 RepID=A0A6G1CPX2_9ORYZ|nr:hypothetical protein E2562_014446 [Oryza meyeriana var. granulata]
MATARACTAVRVAFSEEVPPPETLDVVRRQRQLLRQAAELCLDPIAEEETNEHDDVQALSSTTISGDGPASRRQACLRFIN